MAEGMSPRGFVVAYRDILLNSFKESRSYVGDHLETIDRTFRLATPNPIDRHALNMALKNLEETVRNMRRYADQYYTVSSILDEIDGKEV